LAKALKVLARYALKRWSDQTGIEGMAWQIERLDANIYLHNQWDNS